MHVVVAPTAGQPLLGSPLRAAAAAGGLAALVSLAAVYGFESLMTHRRPRRPRKRQLDEDDPGATTAPGSGRGHGAGAAGHDRPEHDLAHADSLQLVQVDSTPGMR
jgi:hypothetical protein